MTGFLMSKFDENLMKASKECSFLSDTISRFIRNLHVLQESRKGLGVLTEFPMLDFDEVFTATKYD